MNKKVINATPVEVNGVKYRSIIESRFAEILKESGLKTEYEKHRFEIIPSIRYNGELLRAVHYTPDFVGDNFIIECKGHPNDSWSLKKKVIVKYLVDNKLPYTFYEARSIRQLKSIIKEIKMNVKEEWRAVVGFEKLYEVSNFGNVRSLQFHGKKRIKYMSLSMNNGYKTVKLRDWENDISKPYKVHILVAQAFLPNPENKPFVDHIDTDKENNYVENLRWVTHLENQNNPITLKRLRSNITAYNKSENHKLDIIEALGKPVSQFTRSGEFIKEYNSLSEAARELDTTPTCIKRVCDNVRKYHRNFIFRYKE